MLTLFHAARSRSSRIVWLLEELDADYDLRHVSITYGDGSGEGPDLANLHPDKKVPALLHDGTLVTECNAVALYLTELFAQAGLAPTPGEAQRAPFLTWLAWAENEVGPALFTPDMPPLDAFLTKKRGEVLARMEHTLSRGPYLLGDRFSAADVMVAPGLWVQRAKLGASAVLDAYLARMQARSAYARSRARDEAPALAA